MVAANGSRENIMVKAVELRRMVSKITDRRNLIAEELKRLDNLLIRTAQEGQTDCKFYLGDNIESKDPVYMAVVAYCKENGLSCVYSSLEDPVLFDGHTYIQISWALYG